MATRIRPGKLGEKLDSRAREAYYSLKGEDRGYTLANFQNLHPILTQEQVAIYIALRNMSTRCGPS